MNILKFFFGVLLLLGLGGLVFSIYQTGLSWISVHGDKVSLVRGILTGYGGGGLLVTQVGGRTEYNTEGKKPAFEYETPEGMVQAVDPNYVFLELLKPGTPVTVALSDKGAVLDDFQTRYITWIALLLVSLLPLVLTFFLWPVVSTSGIPRVLDELFAAVPLGVKILVAVIVVAIVLMILNTQVLQKLPSRTQSKESSQLADAVLSNEEAQALALLEAGASPDAFNETTGLSVLMIALREKRDWIIDVLIDKGASLEAVDKIGRTVLYFAVDTGNLAALEKMLAKGVKSFDCEYEDLLLCAFKRLNQPVAQRLVDAGFPVDQPEKSTGRTYGALARDYGLTDLAQYIETK